MLCFGRGDEGAKNFRQLLLLRSPGNTALGAAAWGAVAARDIEWDEPFIVMPRAAIRTPIDARAEGLIGAGNLAPPAALAALIVRAARRREQQSPDQKVPLAAYVGMLPPLAAVRERHTRAW